MCMCVRGGGGGGGGGVEAGLSCSAMRWCAPRSDDTHDLV